MLEKKLPDTGEQDGSEKHYDVPHRSRMLSRIKDVGG
jgi:hypothetical protein